LDSKVQLQLSEGQVTGGAYRKSSSLADYCLDVTYEHEETGRIVVVPGYYTLSGDTEMSSGGVWLAHFGPEFPGTWQWSISFLEEIIVAPNGGGDFADHFDGEKSSFVVGELDKKGTDLRTKGCLQYVGKHHLQFAGSGEYFLLEWSDQPSMCSYVYTSLVCE
jgi:hypothetical protein